ncbi:MULTISPECIES: uroporphyrinogen decarboxylase [Gordonia]|nr:uroporphyrinogen decarboxylase [Gordonia sp. UBA5067]
MAVVKPLLAAANGQSPSRRPVWFMRQAGRSLPEYRALRADRGMLEACFDPAMVCEITMQPVRRHDTDGAILFSDIVVPLKAAGIDLDIVAGTGPVIAHPVRTAADVEAIGRLDPEAVGAIGRAVALLRAELDPTPTALIGFAGAPFTLASYLIEGGPSRHYAHTKAMMYGNPALWHSLMARLADITVAFLIVQLRAGVQAVQLFDSWAGMLSRRDYETFVAPHSTRVFAEIAAAQTGGAASVPRIHFGVGTGELLVPMARVGADVVGVDWRVPLDEAIARIGPGPALQGNLDPTVLFAGETVIAEHVRRVIADADRALAAGARGHIFNLGHGVLPDTDPDAITRVVELVHSA